MPPGVDRHDVALLPLLLGGRAVEAGAAGDQAVFEGEPTVGFLAAQRLDHLGLGRARAVAGDHRLHGGEHCFRRDLQFRQFVGGFFHALALQHEQRVNPVGIRKRAAQGDRGVVGQEAEFGGDAFGLQPGLADVVARHLHGVGRAVRTGLRLRRPHRPDLALKLFQAVAEIGGLFRHSPSDRRIPADSG